MLRKNKKKLFAGFDQMAIAKRITLLYGGIFTLSLLFLSFFMVLNISSMQQSTMRKELLEAMELVEGYLDSGEPLSDEALETLLQESYVEVSVFSYSEDEMYYSHHKNVIPFVHHPEEPEEKEKKSRKPEPPSLREKELKENGFEIMGKKESPGGDLEYILESESNQQIMLLSAYHKTEEGLYRIQTFRMLADGGYMILNFMSKMLIADIIGICCAFLIGRYISRRMLRPMAAIREAAERISIEDLSQRISTEGPEDEMKELTETFNSMIDRLETSFQKQNQFISDASHELRTPISVIQGYASLINRWGKSDPAILQESIDSILTETEHMSALIRQLLFLAKGDQKRLSPQLRCVSLTESAEELVREMSMLHQDREILFQGETETEILADEDMLKQLLWIHGENALKYSAGKIEVSVWKDDAYGYVSVRDHGIGIAEEERSRLFDRFYRADKSRNKEIAGTGLGLAIASWIVDAHGGEIIVKSTVGEGSEFIDKFPLHQRMNEDRKGDF